MRPTELKSKRTARAAQSTIPPRPARPTRPALTTSADPSRANPAPDRPPSAAHPVALDLSRIDEVTRRALYDAVVAIHFYPSRAEVRRASRRREWYQRYTPDECRVNVSYLYGRWFVTWRIWDAGEGAPEQQEWQMMTVLPNPGMPFGIEFYEV